MQSLICVETQKKNPQKMRYFIFRVCLFVCVYECVCVTSSWRHLNKRSLIVRAFVINMFKLRFSEIIRDKIVCQSQGCVSISKWFFFLNKDLNFRAIKIQTFPMYTWFSKIVSSKYWISTCKRVNAVFYFIHTCFLSYLNKMQPYNIGIIWRGPTVP